MKTIKNKSHCCLFVLFLFGLTVSPQPLLSQVCYNPYIDSIMSEVSLQSISMFVREFSGEIPAIIGGQPYTIISRYWEHQGNIKAAQYIYGKFQSYGLETRYQVYSPTGSNVLAKKTGTKYPNKQFIISAHYDDYAHGVPITDTVPGADDDGSGMAGVLEAARILSQYDLDYTVIFAAFDEEERFMFGSYNYADTAILHGDSILNVFNLDMIGYDSDNDHYYSISTDAPSLYYANVFRVAGIVYQPFLIGVLVAPCASDQLPFQEKGYSGITAIENIPDYNPYYHGTDEKFSHFNTTYFEGLVKTAVASVLVSQYDALINFEHTPLQSSCDTTARSVTAVITSNHRIDKTVNSPRLYYRVDNGPFIFTHVYYNNLDTFKFLIPGKPMGSIVRYYFSAQDSAGTMVGSLPAGAKGISPPGTIPPGQQFSYRILKPANYCSNSVPKQILPGQYLYDTIRIYDDRISGDCDLNLTILHSCDSLLYIWLYRPGLNSSVIGLSLGNGASGANYINTTFDDEAEISIRQGSPPFTGSYRPVNLLNVLDNSSLQGDWILRVYNHSQSITGQLVNWCLNFSYYDPIGIVNNQIPVKSSLSQNYPNPFNSSTRINFSLDKRAHVRLVIYDILGREVQTLVSGSMNSGEHIISFNADDFATGLYFYSLFIDGGLYAAKKMVLIK